MPPAPSLEAELAPHDAMEQVELSAGASEANEGVTMLDAPAPESIAIHREAAVEASAETFTPASPPSRAPAQSAPRPLAEPIVTRPYNLPDIPPVSLGLPPESGLVLIETTHRSEPVVEENAEPRPKRVRPPRTAMVDEPLELVETRKDSAPPAA